LDKKKRWELLDDKALTTSKTVVTTTDNNAHTHRGKVQSESRTSKNKQSEAVLSLNVTQPHVKGRMRAERGCKCCRKYYYDLNARRRRDAGDDANPLRVCRFQNKSGN
jgi:hypothetical protein